MVTFEEFFEKKKIDLSLLQQDNATLYKEFADHFEQMGAKSFDHSKKFWFNRLRKDYHLADKPVVPPVEKVITATVATASISPAEDIPASAASKPAGFKPRFKAGATKPMEEIPAVVETKADSSAAANSPAEDIPASTASKPAGFKPRFKAGATKPLEETPAVAETKVDPSTASIAPAEDIPASTASKPAGFRPRFKAGATKPLEGTPAVEETKVDPSTASIAPAEDIPASTTSKPAGFRPRFKAGVTKPVEATPAVAEDKVQSAESPDSSTAAITPAEDLPASTASKPVGFKPRFKAGVTKAVEATPAVAETKVDPSTAAIPPAEDIPAHTASKPVGFKPRFKAGDTKPVEARPAVAEDKVESVEITESSDASAASIPPAEDLPASTANKPVGFKPRFKAGVTKAVEATPVVAETKVESAESSDSSAASIPPAEDVPASTASKPVGFKPRFKAGVTKAVAATPALAEEKVESVETTESPDASAASISPSEDLPASTANKPVGFKPRFKAGITNNKLTDDKSSGQE